MTFKKLYVIGNGFDLHYGIKSRYVDFRAYLESAGNEGFTYAIEEASTIDLWQDFESALGALPRESLLNDFYGLLSQGDHDFEDYFQQMLAAYDYHLEAVRKDFNSAQLKAYFDQWVNQIDISPAHDDGLIIDDESTLYFTFNYTRTLETVLHVSPNRILHVHGVQGNGNLVIGHEPILDDEPPEQGIAPEFYQEDLIEDARLSFIRETEKPVDHILSKNSSFFDALFDVEEVYVIGFSFGKVDLPYIEKIKQAVSPSCKWFVYCRKPSKSRLFPAIDRVEVLPFPVT